MGKYLQHPFFQKMKGRWVLQVLFFIIRKFEKTLKKP